MNEAIHKKPKVCFDLMVFDNNILMLSLNLLPYLGANLVGNVVHMRPAIRSANWVDKGHLVELTIRVGDDYFPVVTAVLDDGKLFMLVNVKIQFHIVFKPVNGDKLVIQSNFNFGTNYACHIIGSLSE